MVFYTSNNSFYFTLIKISSFDFSVSSSNVFCYINGIENYGDFQIKTGDRYFFTSGNLSNAQVTIDGVAQTIEAHESITIFDVNRSSRFIAEFLSSFTIDNIMYTGIIISDGVTGYLKPDIASEFSVLLGDKLELISHQLNQFVFKSIEQTGTPVLSFIAISDILKSMKIEWEVYQEDLSETPTIVVDTILSEFQYYPELISFEKHISEFLTDSELLDVARDFYNIIWNTYPNNYIPTSIMNSADVQWIVNKKDELGIQVLSPNTLENYDSYIKKSDLLIATNEQLVSLVVGLLSRIEQRLEYSLSVLVDDLTVGNAVSSSPKNITIDSANEYQVAVIVDILKLDNPAFITMAIDSFEDVLTKIAQTSNISTTVVDNLTYTQISPQDKPVEIGNVDLSSTTEKSGIEGTTNSEITQGVITSVTTQTVFDTNESVSQESQNIIDVSYVDGVGKSPDSLDDIASVFIESTETSGLSASEKLGVDSENLISETETTESSTQQIQQSELESALNLNQQQQSEILSETDSSGVVSLDGSLSEINSLQQTDVLSNAQLDGLSVDELKSSSSLEESNFVLSDGIITTGTTHPTTITDIGVNELEKSESQTNNETVVVNAIEQNATVDIKTIEFVEMELDSAVIDIEYKDIKTLITQSEILASDIAPVYVENLSVDTFNEANTIVDVIEPQIITTQVISDIVESESNVQFDIDIQTNGQSSQTFDINESVLVDFKNQTINGIKVIEDYVLSIISDDLLYSDFINLYNINAPITERLEWLIKVSNVLNESTITPNPVLSSIVTAFSGFVINETDLNTFIVSQSLLKSIISDNNILSSLYQLTFETNFLDLTSTNESVLDVSRVLLNSVLGGLITTSDNNVYNINTDYLAIMKSVFSVESVYEILNLVSTENEMSEQILRNLSVLLLSDDTNQRFSFSEYEITEIANFITLAREYVLTGNVEILLTKELNENQFIQNRFLVESVLLSELSKLTSYVSAEYTTKNEIITNLSVSVITQLTQTSQSLESVFLFLNRIISDTLSSSSEYSNIYQEYTEYKTNEFNNLIESTLEQFTEIGMIQESTILAEMINSNVPVESIFEMVNQISTNADINYVSNIGDFNIIQTVEQVLKSVSTQVVISDKTTFDNIVEQNVLEVINSSNSGIVDGIVVSVVSNVLSVLNNEQLISNLPNEQLIDIEILQKNLASVNQTIANLNNINVLSLVEFIQNLNGNVESNIAEETPRDGDVGLVIDVNNPVLLTTELNLPSIPEQTTVIDLERIDVTSDLLIASEIMNFIASDLSYSTISRMPTQPLPNPTREEFELILLWLRRKLIQEPITIATPGTRPEYSKVLEYEWAKPLIPLLGFTTQELVVKVDTTKPTFVSTVITKITQAESDIISKIIKQQQTLAEISELLKTIETFKFDVETIESVYDNVEYGVEQISQKLDSADVGVEQISKTINEIESSLQSVQNILDTNSQTNTISLTQKLDNIEANITEIKLVLESQSFDIIVNSPNIESFDTLVQEIKKVIEQELVDFMSIKSNVQESEPLINFAISKINNYLDIEVLQQQQNIQETEPFIVSVDANNTESVNSNIETITQTPDQVDASIFEKSVVIDAIQSLVEQLSVKLQEENINVLEIVKTLDSSAINIIEKTNSVQQTQVTVETVDTLVETTPVEIDVKYNVLDSETLSIQEIKKVIESQSSEILNIINTVDLSNISNIENLKTILEKTDISVQEIKTVLQSVDTSILEKQTILSEEGLGVLELIKSLQTVAGSVLIYENNTDIEIKSTIIELKNSLASVNAKILELVKTLAEIKLTIYTKENLLSYVKMADFAKRKTGDSDDEFDLVYLSWMPKSRQLMYGERWEEYSVAPFPVDFYLIDRFRELYMFITPGNTYEDEMAYLAHITRLYGNYIKGAIF